MQSFLFTWLFKVLTFDRPHGFFKSFAGLSSSAFVAPPGARNQRSLRRLALTPCVMMWFYRLLLVLVSQALALKVISDLPNATEVQSAQQNMPKHESKMIHNYPKLGVLLIVDHVGFLSNISKAYFFWNDLRMDFNMTLPLFDHVLKAMERLLARFFMWRHHH